MRKMDISKCSFANINYKYKPSDDSKAKDCHLRIQLIHQHIVSFWLILQIFKKRFKIEVTHELIYNYSYVIIPRLNERQEYRRRHQKFEYWQMLKN